MSTLIAALESLWSASTEPPDLNSWWSSVTAAQKEVSADEVLSALLLDQRNRWRTAKPLTAEDYIRTIERLPDGIDWPLELAAGEFEARTAASQTLSIDEFTARFPAVAETLRDRLQQIASDVIPTEIVTGVVRMQADVLNDRYRLDRLLGQGRFGKVFLAWDLQLQRDVAIKVPTDIRFQDLRHAEDYLREARTLARVDHPGILPVYDVGCTADSQLYVVSRFIDGITLGKLLKQQRPALETVSRILIPVAEALAFAHERRIIHRDVKPDNILIEVATGRPFLADFGLAVGEQDYTERSELAGTPAYMSPEQVRGEGHRLDGRSDVFSLGVILYEMLTGQRPFTAADRNQLFHQITTVEPTAPRVLDPSIPAELESVCLKAIAKRSSDRFETAGVFAEALKDCLVRGWTPTAAVSTAVVQPRGLRSFDADDSEVFLQLLPGLKNRAGLPESIAFWKEQIEKSDAENTFSVGLIYGPSGCGKSSLVKAGLLPRLSRQIRTIYLEATATSTEEGLSRQLRKLRPDLSGVSGLVELLTAIRRGTGPKIVIFLDQFEQWLHRNPAGSQTELVLALRQCDGARLQAVLMIRDDFYASVSRLMQQLDIDIVQRKNCMMIDLFDLEHAANVLRKFGSSYGRLPPLPAELSLPQQNFVRRVVESLAENNQVISVRLALFCDMVRHREWTADTLQEIGGADGVGVAFLEETFANSRSDVRYRRHQLAVRGILKALLPGADAEFKGNSCTSQHLQTAAGYTDNDRDFKEVIRILDVELRLITPTESDAAVISGASLATAADQSQFYQLTHDYLVPALREWLTRRQKETPAGRAELALEERTRVWEARRESRHLPSLSEYCRICWYLRRQPKTPAQQLLLRAAGRLQLFRGGIVFLLLTLALLVGLSQRRQAEMATAELRASNIAQTKTSELAAALQPLQSSRKYALPTLQKLYAKSAEMPEDRLHLAIARMLLGDNAADLLPTARDLALQCRPDQMLPLTELLQPWAAEIVTHLRSILTDDQQKVAPRLRAACFLAAWKESVPDAGKAWSDPSTSDFVASELIRIAGQSSTDLPYYKDVLHPAAKDWLPKLVDIICTNEVADEIQPGVWRLLASDQELASKSLLARLGDENDLKLGDENDLKRSAAAAAALLHFQKDRVWELLKDSPDPTLRNLILQRMPDFGCEAKDLLEVLQKTADVGIRRGVIQGLGELAGRQQLSEVFRTQAEETLLQLYKTDPDAGVHAASAWTLRRLGAREKLNEVRREFQTGEVKGDRRWYVAKTDFRWPPDPQQQYHALLDQLTQLTAEQFDAPENRRNRAEALYQTDQLADALKDLDWLAEKHPLDPEFSTYRILALARLQRQDEAEQVFDQSPPTADRPSMRDYIKIQMLATHKNPETVLEALDAAATRYAKSGGELYNIARAAAVSARILRQLDVPDGAKKLRDKAISLLTDSTKEGFRDLEHISRDVDLLELNADPRFVRLLSEIGPKELLDHRGLEFAVIDARGEVRNGATESVLDDSTGALRRPLQIGRVYAVGMYEITEAQYSASGLRQKYTAKPVSVTWHQAARYCNWLSREEGIPEDQWCYRPAEPASERLELRSNWQDLTGYRMPTEEEWEFACRAGTDTEHSFGRELGLHRDFGWYRFNNGGYSEPRQIGLLRANGFGLFDMHGNMWEWCDSMYWRTTAEPPTGKVATEESPWVLRSGDVDVEAQATSSSYRSPQPRDQPNEHVGFRVSRTLRLLP